MGQKYRGDAQCSKSHETESQFKNNLSQPY